MAKFKVQDLLVLLDAAWNDEITDRPRPVLRGICPSSGATPTCPSNSLDRGICPSSYDVCIKVSIVVQMLERVEPDDLTALRQQLAEALELVAQREFAVSKRAPNMDSSTADAVADALKKTR